MSKGINLLGAEKQISVKKASRKIKLVRTVAIGLLFGVSGLSIVLFLLIALSPLPSLQKQEQNALNTLVQYHPDVAKLFLVKERIKASELILATRSNFDQTLNKITEKIPGNATITGLTMNTDEISVTVTSTSLASLDTFLNSLVAATEAKEYFSKVILTKFLTNPGNSTYSLTVRVETL